MTIDMLGTAAPQDLLEAIEWSYRLFLGREAESASHVREHIAAHASIQDVRDAFMSSDEFQKRIAFSRLVGSGTASELIARFDVAPKIGQEGFWTDFLGVRTRCAYLPQEFGRFSGLVFDAPDQRSEDMHDLAEWVALLQAVEEAKVRNTFSIVELGAGWGPWIVGGAKAAEIAGIVEIDFLGVEAAREHVDFMRQHIDDNAVGSHPHRIVHGAIGAADGHARFPRLSKPSENWGARATFGTAEATDDTEEVPCFSLETLLRDRPVVDLMHCDIQGAEAEALPAAAATLNSRVRRLVVGTHSREVEGRLLAVFANEGWVLEHDAPCKYAQTPSGSMTLLIDGCQIWRNRAFDGGHT